MGRFLGDSSAGTLPAIALSLRRDAETTQTVERGGERDGFKAAFTVCNAELQTLHTKQNPELVQQLS